MFYSIMSIFGLTNGFPIYPSIKKKKKNYRGSCEDDDQQLIKYHNQWHVAGFEVLASEVVFTTVFIIMYWGS